MMHTLLILFNISYSRLIYIVCVYKEQPLQTSGGTPERLTPPPKKRNSANVFRMLSISFFRYFVMTNLHFRYPLKQILIKINTRTFGYNRIELLFGCTGWASYQRLS
jgi:hypothetical protein